MPPGRCLALSALAVSAACVSVPPIQVVDRRTALETQAAGDMPALENELEQAALSPRGEPIPRERLMDRPGGDLGEVAELFVSAQTDAAWIDRALVAGCVGEALEGTLVATPERCEEDLADLGGEAERARVLARTNLHRRQVWAYIARQREGATEAEARAAWRAQHLKRVVCGALVEVEAGRWEKKAC
jgi:uncharacterized protein YdbL (DUF1318 family)